MSIKSIEKSFNRLEEAVDGFCKAIRHKHLSHNQSTHGRGGGGGEFNRGSADNPIEAETLRDLLVPSGEFGRLGTKDIGSVVVKGYRVGETKDKHKRGVFYSGDKEGAEAYVSLHEGKKVEEYTLPLSKALLAGHQNDVSLEFFGKGYGQVVDQLSRRAGSGVAGGRAFDRKVAREAKKRGYDSIIYMKPAPPATTEIAVFPSKKRK